jgi:hypothetical protein
MFLPAMVPTGSKICIWGSVSIKINDDIGFRTQKFVKQGNPISPILFNTVANMLSVLIRRAKDDVQIKGMIPHLVEETLSIRQYSDETITFMEHDLEYKLR